MQTTLTPNAERLSAALRALKLTHDHDGESDNKKVLAAKCLKVVLAQLFEEGVPQDELQPLIDSVPACRRRRKAATREAGSAC
jgi:hypothetical protein